MADSLRETEVTSIVEAYGVDRKNYPFSQRIQIATKRAKTTRREASIIAVCVANQTNKAALKGKVAIEKSKAVNEKVFDCVHEALVAIMSRAEGGRGLGAAGQD